MEAPLRKRRRSDAAATWSPGEPNPVNTQPTYHPPAALGAPAIALYKNGQLVVKLNGKASPRLPKGAWITLVGLLGDGKGQCGGHAAVPRTAWRFNSSTGIEAAAFPPGGAEVDTQLGGTGAGPSQQQQRVPKLYIAVSLDGGEPAPVDGNAVDEGEKRRQHVWLFKLRRALAAVQPGVSAALSRVTLHACSVYTPAPGQVLLLLDVSTWTKDPSATQPQGEGEGEGEGEGDGEGEGEPPPRKRQVRHGAWAGTGRDGHLKTLLLLRVAGGEVVVQAVVCVHHAVQRRTHCIPLPVPRPRVHTAMAAFQLPPLLQMLLHVGQEVRLHRQYQFAFSGAMLDCIRDAGVQQQTSMNPGAHGMYMAESAHEWAFSEDSAEVVLTSQQAQPQEQEQQQQAQSAGGGEVARVRGDGDAGTAGGGTDRAAAVQPLLLLAAISLDGGPPIRVDATITLYPKHNKLVVRTLRDVLHGVGVKDSESRLHGYTLYRTQPHGHVLLLLDICRCWPAADPEAEGAEGAEDTEGAEERWLGLDADEGMGAEGGDDGADQALQQQREEELLPLPHHTTIPPTRVLSVLPGDPEQLRQPPLLPRPAAGRSIQLEPEPWAMLQQGQGHPHETSQRQHPPAALTAGASALAGAMVSSGGDAEVLTLRKRVAVLERQVQHLQHALTEASEKQSETDVAAQELEQQYAALQQRYAVLAASTAQRAQRPETVQQLQLQLREAIQPQPAASHAAATPNVAALQGANAGPRQELSGQRHGQRGAERVDELKRHPGQLRADLHEAVKLVEEQYAKEMECARARLTATQQQLETALRVSCSMRQHHQAFIHQMKVVLGKD